jgi:uncharacterized protein YqgC (DUF456 family)
LGGEEERGDLSSTVAFSLLIVIPAIAATALWATLKLVHQAFGIDHVPFFPGLLVTLSPVIISVAAAQWACRRSGTSHSTAWGFSIAAAVTTVFFAVFAAAWFIGDVGD